MLSRDQPLEVDSPTNQAETLHLAYTFSLGLASLPDTAS